jgi:hypothetical protein
VLSGASTLAIARRRGEPDQTILILIAESKILPIMRNNLVRVAEERIEIDHR